MRLWGKDEIVRIDDNDVGWIMSMFYELHSAVFLYSGRHTAYSFLWLDVVRSREIQMCLYDI